MSTSHHISMRGTYDLCSAGTPLFYSVGSPEIACPVRSRERSGNRASPEASSPVATDPRPPTPSFPVGESTTDSAAGKLIRGTTNARALLSQSLHLFKPETVLRWHRDLVRRKWTFRHRPAPVGAYCRGTRNVDCALGQIKPALGIQQNRRGTAQAWLWDWALNDSGCPQTLLYSWSTLSYSTKQHLVCLPAPASAPTAGL